MHGRYRPSSLFLWYLHSTGFCCCERLTGGKEVRWVAALYVTANQQSTEDPAKQIIFMYTFSSSSFPASSKYVFFSARQIKKRRKRLGWRAVMLDEWLSKVQKMRRATSGQESVYIGCFAILVVVPNKDGGRKVMKDEMTRFFFFTTQPIKFLISLK